MTGRLPRKVVVGTTIFGRNPHPGLAERADELVRLVDSMAAESERLDLVVLPEAVLTPNAPLAPDRSVSLDDPAVLRLREAARRHRTYVLLGLDLAEDGSYANAAVLLDRDGAVAGISRAELVSSPGRRLVMSRRLRLPTPPQLGHCVGLHGRLQPWCRPTPSASDARSDRHRWSSRGRGAAAG